MRSLVEDFARALQEQPQGEEEPEDGQQGQVDAAAETEAPEGATRVPLAVGQQVEVRTRRTGELIATGYISELDTETRVARVIDRGSGTDLQLDVDPDMYDIWLQDEGPTGTAPTPAKQPRLSVHSKLPGAYVGGRFKH